jgi:hypothetical protein
MALLLRQISDGLSSFGQKTISNFTSLCAKIRKILVVLEARKFGLVNFFAVLCK